jgi:formate/nitrite transporter FocA (FNT family)
MILGLTNNELAIVVIKSILSGVLWGLSFFYIRKGLNWRLFLEDRNKSRKTYKWDAIYGGLAIGIMMLFQLLIHHRLETFFRR